MTDYTLADTIYLMFTTRAFATGIPTVLTGSPIVSAYENENLTQITGGVTLGVDHDGVVGLNLLTIVATTGNTFETGKDYNLVITVGTVGGVSVVGEVVGTFSLGRSASNTSVAALNDVAATDIVSSGAITTSSGSVVTVTTSTNLTTNNDKTGYSISGSITTLDGLNDVAATDIVSAGAITTLTGSVVSVDLVDVLTTYTGNTLQTIDAASLNDVAATDIVTAGAIGTLSGAIINVDLVDTLTTYTGNTLQTIDAASLNDVAATDIVTAGAIGTLSGAIINVDLVDTLTTYTGNTPQTADNDILNQSNETLLLDIPTTAEFEVRTPTAAELLYMTENANTGLPVTFTTSGGDTVTAVLNLVDGGAGNATDDQYNGRLLVFTDGTLKGVVTDITDYDGGTTTATITAIPVAPTSSHNARLI